MANDHLSRLQKEKGRGPRVERASYVRGPLASSQDILTAPSWVSAAATAIVELLMHRQLHWQEGGKRGREAESGWHPRFALICAGLNGGNAAWKGGHGSESIGSRNLNSNKQI